MKTTRRDFLKLAVGAAVGVLLKPSAALAELTHGASDLTPRERDAVADAMGLRREQWSGWDWARPDSEYVVYAMPGARKSYWTVDNFGLTIGQGTTIVGLGDSAARPSFTFGDDDGWDLIGRGPIEITFHGTWEPGATDTLAKAFGAGSLTPSSESRIMDM